MSFEKKNSNPVRIFKGLLWTRFISGFFHQDLMKSNRAQFLAQTYCVLVTAVSFVAMLHYAQGSKLTQMVIIAHAIDYLFPSVLSLCSDTYCSMDYFNEVLSRCERRHEKIMSRLLVTTYISCCYHIIRSVFYSTPMYFLSIGGFKSDLFIWLVFLPCFATAMEFGNVLKWISLILMYCDMKALFDAVERVNIQRREVVFDYMVKYEKISKGFDRVMSEVKILISYRLITMWPIIMLCIDTYIINPQNSPAVEHGIPASQILYDWVTIGVLRTILPLLLLDLVADLEDKIVVCISDKRIACSDSDTCAEMDRFVSYVRGRPPRWSLLRAVPLEGGLAFGVASLAISYIIAWLQFTRINIKPSTVPSDRVT